MRYLGIDYGTKRIGIALSDPEGRVAFPKKTIPNRGGEWAAREIKTFAFDEKASEIILGLPISLDGRETEITSEVRRFAETLERTAGIAVHLENEMLTTRIVKQAGIEKEHTDEAAAALILQSYLDKHNG